MSKRILADNLDGTHTVYAKGKEPYIVKSPINYRDLVREIASSYGDHYDDYFDRWEEAPFHMPEDSESFGLAPADIPNQIFDVGDYAQEQVRTWNRFYDRKEHPAKKGT